VLVLEDDPSVLSAVERLLRFRGYDVEGFSSIADFVAHADIRQACCLLLDIHLKDGSGIELHEQLKHSGISPPVIFMTGRDNEMTRKAALAGECVAYLLKPFSSGSLLAALDVVRPMT
jgi:DNA-binding response OmpR family regulator